MEAMSAFPLSTFPLTPCGLDLCRPRALPVSVSSFPAVLEGFLVSSLPADSYNLPSLLEEDSLSSEKIPLALGVLGLVLSGRRSMVGLCVFPSPAAGSFFDDGRAGL